MMTTDIGPYVYDVRLINDYTNRDIHLMRAHSIGELFDTLPDNITLHRWTSDEESRTAPNGKVIMKELGPECLRDFINIVSFRYGREGIHLYVNSQRDVRVHLNISPIGRSWSRLNDGTNSGPNVAFDDWAVGEEE